MGTRFKPNKRINHWGIVSKLGTGGSFNRGIFLVDDLNDLLETRQGIMKVLPSHALDPDYAQREISILAPLRHNNIVQLYDSYMPEQPKHPHATPWMVTEYCDKGTLKDLVRNTNKAGGKLPECFLWQVFESLARAVHYCHNGPIMEIQSTTGSLSSQSSSAIGDVPSPLLSGMKQGAMNRNSLRSRVSSNRLRELQPRKPLTCTRLESSCNACIP
jgi:hypothetical protein